MSKADTAGFEFKGRINNNTGKKYEMVKTIDGEKYIITIMDTDNDGFDAKDTIKISKGNISVFASKEVRNAVLKGIKGNDDNGYDAIDSNRPKKNNLKEIPTLGKGDEKLKADKDVEYSLESFMNFDKAEETQKDKPAPEANKAPEKDAKKDAAGSSAPETQVFDPRVLINDGPSPMHDPGFGLMLNQVYTSSVADSMLMGGSDYGSFCGPFGGGFGGGFGFGAPMMMPMSPLFGGLIGGACGGIFGGLFGGLFGGRNGFSTGLGAGFLGGMLGGLFGSMFSTPSYSYPQASYQQGGYPQYYAPQEQYYTPVPQQQAPATTTTQPVATQLAATAPASQSPEQKGQAADASASGSQPSFSTTNAPTPAPTADVAVARGVAPAPTANATSATTPTGEAKPQEVTIEVIKAKRDEYSTKIDELRSKYKEPMGEGTTYSNHVKYLAVFNKAMTEAEALNPTSEDYKKRLGQLNKDINRAMEILDAHINKKSTSAGTSAPAATTTVSKDNLGKKFDEWQNGVFNSDGTLKENVEAFKMADKAKYQQGVEQLASDMVDNGDTNHDGKLSLAEITDQERARASKLPFVADNEKITKDMVKQYETMNINDDGGSKDGIDKKEYAAYFVAADTDGDGLISQDEYFKMATESTSDDKNVRDGFKAKIKAAYDRMFGAKPAPAPAAALTPAPAATPAPTPAAASSAPTPVAANKSALAAPPAPTSEKDKEIAKFKAIYLELGVKIDKFNDAKDPVNAKKASDEQYKIRLKLIELGLSAEEVDKLSSASAPATSPTVAPTTISSSDADSCAPNIDPQPTGPVSEDGNSMSKAASESAPAESAPPASKKAPSGNDPFEDAAFVSKSKLELRPQLKEAEPVIKSFSVQIKNAGKDPVELQKIGTALSNYRADNENKLSKRQIEALDKLRSQVAVLVEKASQKPAVKAESTPSAVPVPAKPVAPVLVKTEPPMSEEDRLMKKALPEAEQKPKVLPATKVPQELKLAADLSPEELSKEIQALNWNSHTVTDPTKLAEVAKRANDILTNNKNLTPEEAAKLKRTIAMASTPKDSVNKYDDVKGKVYEFANSKTVPEDSASKIAELKKAQEYVSELKELSKKSSNNVSSIKFALMGKAYQIYDKLPAGEKEPWMTDMLSELNSIH